MRILYTPPTATPTVSRDEIQRAVEALRGQLESLIRDRPAPRPVEIDAPSAALPPEVTGADLKQLREAIEARFNEVRHESEKIANVWERRWAEQNDHFDSMRRDLDAMSEALQQWRAETPAPASVPVPEPVLPPPTEHPSRAAVEPPRNEPVMAVAPSPEPAAEPVAKTEEPQASEPASAPEFTPEPTSSLDLMDFPDSEPKPSLWKRFWAYLNAPAVQLPTRKK